MILTLCGSARFERWFHSWNRELTLAGHVVISLAGFPSLEGGKDWYTKEEKRRLDLIHLRKIEVSDAIVVLNAFGYIGESLLREIEWADLLGKEVHFLESWGEGLGVGKGYTTEEAARSLGLELPVRSPIKTAGRRSILDLLGPGGLARSRAIERLEKDGVK